MPRAKKPSWSSVKSAILGLEQDEVLELLRDLYALSNNTKQFFHSRLKLGDDRLAPYKKTISDCMSPDIWRNEDIDLRTAKKAIAEYRKAADDIRGEIDLMIYFVECGNAFTCEFGDIDSRFYESLINMYEKAIQAVVVLSEAEQEPFRKRLKDLVELSSGIGWGYHDALGDEYYSAFDEEVD